MKMQKIRALQQAVRQGARGVAPYVLAVEASRRGVYLPGVKPLPQGRELHLAYECRPEDITEF